MDNLFLFNECPSVGEAQTYIPSRKGPAILGDKGLTLIHPFYNEKHRFDLQLQNWMGWSEYVRDRVRIIIVDDGSPNPVVDYITKNKAKYLSYFNFSIYRIEPNLKWNTPGALNLGLTVAPTEWVLIMDSDCALDDKNMTKLLSADPEPFAVYKFPRQRLGSSKERLDNKRFLPCTMLMHKSLVWKMGGFDEDYTGEYSGGYAFFDTDFDDRAFLLRPDHPMFIWNEITATEWMPSLSNNEIVSRRPSEEKINRKLLYAKREIRKTTLDVSNPSQILRFTFKRVYHNERP